ncbi:Hypothetical predicted protein [Paramuricea clavata]|uniref:Uncharacterized protein n=2 Tax=Paramuricea clavata TaxID=317549 RepID=A0A6S7FNN2_PARCT|nr:Hypothetical predicted protein [Paramuricea clavata]
MSVITAEVLNTIFDQKLEPLNKKIDEAISSMSFINEKYEQILVKLSKFEEEKKSLVNENKALNNELQRATNKLQEIMKSQDDMEQYIRRECLEIRGIPCLNDQENTNTTLNDSTAVAKMAQFDSEMKAIFDKNDTSQHEKAKLYSQILENYLHFKRKRNVEVTKPVPIAFAGDVEKMQRQVFPVHWR